MTVFACSKNNKRRIIHVAVAVALVAAIVVVEASFSITQVRYLLVLGEFPGNDFGLGLHRLLLIYLSNHSIYSYITYI